MENLSKIQKIKIKINKKKFKKLPDTPGVYFFFSAKEIIYIGKAINLKSRLNSYLLPNLGPKTSQMIKTAKYISYLKVFSELEALLLESNLIHKHKPKFNIIAKDDKHALYIVITNDKFPRLLTCRKLDAFKYTDIFGPFPNSKNIRTILKLIRKIFPFSDHKLGKKPCLYSHLRLCNPCPNIIVQSSDRVLGKIYFKNIKNIKLILSRKFNKVRNSLEREMSLLSKQENYEQASLIRDQIVAFDYITQEKISDEKFLQNPNLREDVNFYEICELKKLLNIKKIRRIECFDIAHLAGFHPTASMVVFINGEAEKNLYKHFKIRQRIGNSDFDSMEEVARRRSNHLKSWGKPDLIIVDGGLPQIKAFNQEFRAKNIEVVGIAKNPDRLIIKGRTLSVKLYDPSLQLVVRMRNEAHRFARRYHHLLIKKNLLN